MVKGIVNAFDHAEFCLGLFLKLPVQMANGLLYAHQYLLQGMLVLVLTFIPGSKHLLPSTIWYKLWNAPSFKDLIKLLWLFVN